MLFRSAAGIASAEATRGSASGDLGAAEAIVRGTTINTAPDVAAAEARLEKARLDLARTVLRAPVDRSEEHTSELTSLMRISYAVFCLKKKIDRKSRRRISVNKSAHRS